MQIIRSALHLENCVSSGTKGASKNGASQKSCSLWVMQLGVGLSIALFKAHTTQNILTHTLITAFGVRRPKWLAP